MFRYHQRLKLKQHKRSQNHSRRNQLKTSCEPLPGISQIYNSDPVKGRTGLGFYRAHKEQQDWYQEDLGEFRNHSDISRWHEKHQNQILEEVYPGSGTSLHDRTRWKTSKQKTCQRRQRELIF